MIENKKEKATYAKKPSKLSTGISIHFDEKPEK